MAAEAEATLPVLALDVGGTKLAAGVVDRGGRVSAAASVDTPTGDWVDAESLWRAVSGMLDRFTDGVGVSAFGGVGVGCGGPMRWPAGEVSSGRGIA